MHFSTTNSSTKATIVFSCSNSVNEDFTVLLLQFPTPQIVFPTGSRSGNTSCGYFTIVDDNYAEVFEVFSINFVSQNEDVAAISDSTLTVSIEDDDGNDI